MADVIGVLYLGRLVEEAPRDRLFDAPKHPYTQMLFAAAPRMDGFGRDIDPPTGEIPDPINPPPGCVYHPRCPLATEVCRTTPPEMRRIGETRVACHHAE
jgi:peptide/nickel transport system ATP-binding protein